MILGSFRHGFPMSCHIRVYAWNLVYRLYGADVKAIAAFHTIHLMDGVFFFARAGNAGDRALAGAQRAANATFFIDIEMHQIKANLGGAALISDVGFIFIPEVADGGQHGIGGCLTQTAKRELADGFAQALQFFDVAFSSMT